MIPHIFEWPKKISFSHAGHTGKKISISSLISSLETTIIETESGHENTLIQRECNFIYYVLGGKGYFIINGIKEEFKKGEVVVIPKNNSFTFKGKCKMLLIVSPPFYKEQEEVLK